MLQSITEKPISGKQHCDTYSIYKTEYTLSHILYVLFYQELHNAAIMCEFKVEQLPNGLGCPTLNRLQL